MASSTDIPHIYSSAVNAVSPLDWNAYFGMLINVVEVATTYNILNNDSFIKCDLTSGAFTITLPAPKQGRVYNIKKIDASANALTIDGIGGETIDGSATASITDQYAALTLVCDGTEWWIV